MTETWNLQEIYDRGLTSLSDLNSEQRFLYLLVDLETCSAMEGWDHFFTSDRMQYYDQLKVGLAAAGAQESLQLLNDYEAAFAERGVNFDSESIEGYLSENEDEGFEREWREEYEDLSETRWAQIRQWLLTRGIVLTG